MSESKAQNILIESYRDWWASVSQFSEDILVLSDIFPFSNQVVIRLVALSLFLSHFPLVPKRSYFLIQINVGG